MIQDFDFLCSDFVLGHRAPIKGPRNVFGGSFGTPRRGTLDDPKLVSRDQVVGAVRVQKGQKRLNLDRNHLSM